MADYHFISAQDLLLDSFRLAKAVLDSGYKPNYMVALWRGGSSVGIAVQEFLAYKGVETDHIAVRTSKYTGIDQAKEQVRVHGLDYLVERVNAGDRLLFVDDVYDTGLSMKAAIDTLRERTKERMPQQIKIATVYYKPTRNKSGRVPDFYIHETDKWLFFPHELQGLSKEEILQGHGEQVFKLL